MEESNEAASEAQPVEGLPEWAELPKDLKIPRGKLVGFLRIRSQWTETAWKGDRIVIVWNLSDKEERLAGEKARGSGSDEAMVLLGELSKQLVRSIDGERATLTAVEQLWTDIGPKGRQILNRWYTQNHVLTEEERADFFENCVAVRTAE